MATLLALAAALSALLGPTRGRALLLALLVGLVAQSSVFLGSYGPFAGSAIDWEANAGRGLLEVAFWLALLGAALWQRSPLQRAPGLVLVSALLVHVVGTASSLAGAADSPGDATPASFLEKVPRAGEASERDGLNLRERFTVYSRTSNVVVFVLDAVPSDFFAELLEDESFAERVPPGFTYFRNAVSMYPGTIFSLQSILTSRAIGNGMKRRRWEVRQMRQSVPTRLAARGYVASLLTNTPFHLTCDRATFGYACQSHAAFLPHLAASLTSEAADWDLEDDLRTVWNVTFFRLVPHLVKPWVYNGGSWRLPVVRPPGLEAGSDPEVWFRSQRDLALMHGLIREASTREMPPTFKLIHLFGAHHPSSLDRDCSWNGRKNTARSAKLGAVRARSIGVDAAGCSLSLVFELLAKLDALGVYDDSLVFVVADHGRPATPIDLRLAERPPIDPRWLPPDTPDLATAVPDLHQRVPLFLVKRPSARHPLAFSDVPVSLCDVPHSIFGELGLTAEFGCESIFEIADHRKTPRYYYKDRGDPRKGRRRHWFDRIAIETHSWFASSWQRAP